MHNQLLELVQPAYDMIEDKQLKAAYLHQLHVKMTELRNILLLPDGNRIWAKTVIDRISREVDLSELGYYLKKEYSLPWVADFHDKRTNNCYSQADPDRISYQV